MVASDTEIDDPIARFAQLGKRDRDAILKELSHDQRVLIEGARRDLLAADVLEAERQRRTDRQFHPYSQWLASLIEQSEHATPQSITKTSANALWDVHQALHASRGTEQPGGWLGHFERLRDWFTSKQGSKA